MRTLTERELNRALLARQLLLERGRVPIPRALERIGGIQMQYAPSAYIGLWSRLEGFERPALDRALERRTVVQATLMRATIHLVSRADFWPMRLAIDEPLRGWWFRATKREGERSWLRGIDRRARELLRDRPMRRNELVGALGGDPKVWGGVGLWTALVRVPPSGTWASRRADRYGVAEDWIGPPTQITPSEARAHLVRRYLAAFGPASRDDIRSFTGLPLKAIDDALAAIATRSFVTTSGQALVDVRGAPLPGADTAAPVRFLPTWDATLLAHARRTQILPERHRPRIFGVKTPFSFPTFLVDGQVAGTWRLGDDGRIALEAFEPLTRRVRAELEDEAERLAAFHR
jgi:uncharacterized protein YcaQ